MEEVKMMNSMSIKKRSRDNWSKESYETFTNYFKNKKRLGRRDIIFGIAMAYSWMQTMPRIPEITQTEVSLVNNLVKKFDENKFKELTMVVNNSLVGTSKLLHFSAPDKYPLWDKNVCNAFSLKKNYNYKVEKPTHYFGYKKYCEDLIDNEEKFEEIRKQVEKKYEKDRIKNYSKFRIVDMYMWNKGKTNTKGKTPNQSYFKHLQDKNF
jgi:hypothetical protein